MTMRELILERFGLDFMESTREQLAEVLDEPMDPAATWAEVVADIYSEKIESHDQPADARVRLPARAIPDHQAPRRAPRARPSTSTR